MSQQQPPPAVQESTRRTTACPPMLVCVEDLDGLWPWLRPQIEARVPLRGVILSNKYHRSALVDRLPLEFVTSADRRVTWLLERAHDPVHWFRIPYAKIYLITCQDVEDPKMHYRQTMRPKLQAMLEREPAEWLLVYVVTRALLVAQPRSSRRLYEKIKNDFNVKKQKNRCFMLDAGIGVTQQAEVWEELEERLAEGVQLAFNQRRMLYEEEVRRLSSSRLMPGWDFCRFFLVKESFAFLFEAATLYDDALREYDELEMVFTESSSAGLFAASGFGSLEDGDTKLALLEYFKKPIRQAIARKSVVEADCRQYFFARQAVLLMALDQPLEVVERGITLIRTLGHGFRLRMAGSMDGTVEGWVLSACLSLGALAGEHLQALEASSRGRKEQERAHMHRLLGDIYAFARQKLLVLGVLCGFVDESWVAALNITLLHAGSSAEFLRGGYLGSPTAGVNVKSAFARGRGTRINTENVVIPASVTAEGATDATGGPLHTSSMPATTAGGVPTEGGTAPPSSSSPSSDAHPPLPTGEIVLRQISMTSEAPQPPAETGAEGDENASVSGMSTSLLHAEEPLSTVTVNTSEYHTEARLGIAGKDLLTMPPMTSDGSSTLDDDSSSQGGPHLLSPRAHSSESSYGSSHIVPPILDAPIPGSPRASRSSWGARSGLDSLAGSIPGSPRSALGGRPSGAFDSGGGLSSPRGPRCAPLDMLVPGSPRGSMRGGGFEGSNPLSPRGSHGMRGLDSMGNAFGCGDAGGAIAGFLATLEPSTALQHLRSTSEARRARILARVADASLQAALGSQEQFEASYEDVTSKAAYHFRACGWMRSARVLQGELATLRSRERNYAEAASLLLEQCQQYERERWYLPLSYALPQLHGAQRRSKNVPGYVASALALLALCHETRTLTPGRRSEMLPRPNELHTELIETARRSPRPARGLPMSPHARSEFVLASTLELDVSDLLAFRWDGAAPMQVALNDVIIIKIAVWSGFPSDTRLDKLTLTLTNNKNLGTATQIGLLNGEQAKPPDPPGLAVDTAESVMVLASAFEDQNGAAAADASTKKGVVLPPGRSVVSFQLVLQVEGHYYLHQLSASLGQLSLTSTRHCCSRLGPSHAEESLRCEQHAASSVLHASGVRSRVDLDVIPGAGLLLRPGLQQWVGLLVRPLVDLSGTKLHFSSQPGLYIHAGFCEELAAAPASSPSQDDDAHDRADSKNATLGVGQTNAPAMATEPLASHVSAPGQTTQGSESLLHDGGATWPATTGPSAALMDHAALPRSSSSASSLMDAPMTSSIMDMAAMAIDPLEQFRTAHGRSTRIALLSLPACWSSQDPWAASPSLHAALPPQRQLGEWELSNRGDGNGGASVSGTSCAGMDGGPAPECSLELPPWAATRPSVVWLRVSVGLRGRTDGGSTRTSQSRASVADDDRTGGAVAASGGALATAAGSGPSSIPRGLGIPVPHAMPAGGSLPANGSLGAGSEAATWGMAKLQQMRPPDVSNGQDGGGMVSGADASSRSAVYSLVGPMDTWRRRGGRNSNKERITLALHCRMDYGQGLRPLTRSLPLPFTHPFRLTATAYKAAGGATILQVTLQCVRAAVTRILSAALLIRPLGEIIHVPPMDASFAAHSRGANSSLSPNDNVLELVNLKCVNGASDPPPVGLLPSTGSAAQTVPSPVLPMTVPALGSAALLFVYPASPSDAASAGMNGGPKGSSGSNGLTANGVSAGSGDLFAGVEPVSATIRLRCDLSAPVLVECRGQLLRVPDARPGPEMAVTLAGCVPVLQWHKDQVQGA
eukprot:jgi/Mesvir1/4959/Mv11451-RA.1